MDMSFEQLFEIDQILSAKGWSKLRNNKGEPVENLTFALFERLEDNDEFNLLKILIDKYFLCMDYDSYCFEIARNIEAAFYGEKIVIIPVSDDRGKIKSGHAIGYDLTRFLEEGRFSEMLVQESLDAIKHRLDEFSVIVVDDFVGSGSQFKAFSRRCSATYGLSPSNVYLYSIVMMSKARERIGEHCYSAVPLFEFSPALSMLSHSSSELDPIAVYQRIEARASVGRTYRRGYLKSEALVTMKKTPNNTLPIFWCKNDISGGPWPAIFPRG